MLAFLFILAEVMKVISRYTVVIY